MKVRLYVSEENIESGGHPLWVSRFLLTKPNLKLLSQLCWITLEVVVLNLKFIKPNLALAFINSFFLDLK